MATIASLQTDDWQVALIVAAHNAAHDATVYQRGRSGTREDFAEHFARIYQAMYGVLQAENPQQWSQRASDPRLDAGT